MQGKERLPLGFEKLATKGLDAEVNRLLRIAKTDREENRRQAPDIPMVRIKLNYNIPTFSQFNVTLYNRLDWTASILLYLKYQPYFQALGGQSRKQGCCRNEK